MQATTTPVPISSTTTNLENMNSQSASPTRTLAKDFVANVVAKSVNNISSEATDANVENEIGKKRKSTTPSSSPSKKQKKSLSGCTVYFTPEEGQASFVEEDETETEFESCEVSNYAILLSDHLQKS